MAQAAINPSITPRVNPLLPAFTLWWREVVRFYRQPARVVGVVVSPLLFWVVIGAGFGTSLQKGATGTGNFLNYFFPGALMMIVLFTSIFTMMSVIEDRNEGFLLSVMVAPVHRSGIVLGKVLGGTTLSTIQGLLFLVFAPFIGLKIGIEQFLIVVLVTFLVAFSLTALGFVIAWRMESSQGFHAIINLIPDSPVDAFRRAVSRERRFGLDPMADAHQSAHLRYGRAAAHTVSPQQRTLRLWVCGRQ